MTEQELNISKLSYVNKDFASIYPDLLDLVKTLTNRWDPSSSNESDPGVVLLKVGAFLADHLNYNIDKNIAEVFLPSATQEESVRRIAEFGGYTPNYYRSARGNVSVTYNPDRFDGFFTIPRFSMVIANDDGSIAYTLTQDLTIAQKGVPAVAEFTEGTIQRLSVDSDVITLNNIDDFNRVYFPIKNIAENGVYIYNVDSTGSRDSSNWKNVKYLYSMPLETRCFKIDFDSQKNLPYIEFPTDISNLIGDGLAIFYFYTAGSYGNVKAKDLNTISSINFNNIIQESGRNASVDDFVVSNQGSILNGRDPESIDEIRRSYKKIVGTFDTLVSTQDYSNAIRTVEDDNGDVYISNGIVTDRRIDYNQALNIVTYKSGGTSFENVALNVGKLEFLGAVTNDPDVATSIKGQVCLVGGVTKIFDGTEWVEITELSSTDIDSYIEGMKPYDLIIYALQKYQKANYNSVFYWKALSDSFLQINGDAIKGNEINSTEDKLIDALDDYKVVNHTFRDLNNYEPYCFKNYVPLNVDIVPANKVTLYEKSEIIDNIRRAITDNFNASMIEFGQELDYDKVKKVIEESDSRINYVRLSDFNYESKVMVKDSKNPSSAAEYTLDSRLRDEKGNENARFTFIDDLAAKNVLAGRLCLFNFDENFNYQFGQKDSKAYLDVMQIKTESIILPTGQDGSGGPKYENVTLKDNEYLEIYHPNYYSTNTFGSYVLYQLILNDKNAVIDSGEEYTLKPNETLQICYTDAENIVHTETYTSGTNIRGSFELKDFENDNRATYVKNGDSYKQIASNESISIRGLMSTVLNTNQFVYWSLNNSGNILFTAGEKEYILRDNEFFICADMAKEYINIFGRGTKLERVNSGNEWSLPQSSLTSVNITQLDEDGLAAKIPFVEWSEFASNPLTITEMKVITLDSGCTFSLSGPDKLDGELKTVNGINNNPISYTINGQTFTLPLNDADFYKARTRLDINATKISPMKIFENQKITVSHTAYDGSELEDEITGDPEGLLLQSNIDLHLIGDSSSINLSSYSELGLNINWLTYHRKDIVSNQLVATNNDVTDADIASGGYAYDTYLNVFIPIASARSDGRYKKAAYRPSQDLANNVFLVDNYTRIELPLSTILYGYAPGFANIDREYICQIHLVNEDEGQYDKKVKAWFELEDGTKVNIGHYGFIGEDSDITTATLLNNQSIYIYPDLPNDSDGNKSMTLVIQSDNLSGASVSVFGPTVVIGGSPDIQSDKDEVVDRINDIINKSSNSKVQFHWTNSPESELAMITGLANQYSLFDHNNVANNISIAEIDLANSNIDIIRSMRNY